MIQIWIIVVRDGDHHSLPKNVKDIRYIWMSLLKTHPCRGGWIRRVWVTSRSIDRRNKSHWAWLWPAHCTDFLSNPPDMSLSPDLSTTPSEEMGFEKRELWHFRVWTPKCWVLWRCVRRAVMSHQPGSALPGVVVDLVQQVGREGWERSCPGQTQRSAIYPPLQLSWWGCFDWNMNLQYKDTHLHMLQDLHSINLIAILPLQRHGNYTDFNSQFHIFNNTAIYI
jgi:hypothetical protein